MVGSLLTEDFVDVFDRYVFDEATYASRYAGWQTRAWKQAHLHSVEYFIKAEKLRRTGAVTGSYDKQRSLKNEPPGGNMFLSFDDLAGWHLLGFC